MIHLISSVGILDWIVGGKKFVRRFITSIDREKEKQLDTLGLNHIAEIWTNSLISDKGLRKHLRPALQIPSR